MKLTSAQEAGLKYLAEDDKPSTERSTSAGDHGNVSTPRTNTLVKLADLGLATADTAGYYGITEAGRDLAGTL